MKKYLVFLAAALLQADAWAATYTYTGPAYSPPDLHNFTSCPPGTGNCGAYTTAMAQTGSFTTAAPLPSNLNSQDITAQLTSYSFSDGLTTYSSGDPQVTLVSVSATTTGGVLDFSVHLVRWQTPAPHVIGDHLDQVLVTESGQHNAVCGNIQVNPQGDSCGTSNAGGVFSSEFYCRLLDRHRPSARGHQRSSHSGRMGSAAVGLVDDQRGLDDDGPPQHVSATLLGAGRSQRLSQISYGSSALGPLHGGQAQPGQMGWASQRHPGAAGSARVA
jgi:hypothetical protein